MNWEQVAHDLYDLLDDIDTADDLAKDDDKLYRRLVRRAHAKRFEYATTDRYTVDFKVGDDA